MTTKADNKKFLDEIEDKYLKDEQVEPWESGELGRDPKHARPFKKSLRTSIRLEEDMIESLKELAQEDGLDSYQTYIKKNKALVS
jgi:predicted DNA binding CopG/RHH family protein